MASVKNENMQATLDTLRTYAGASTDAGLATILGIGGGSIWWYQKISYLCRAIEAVVSAHSLRYVAQVGIFALG